MFGFLDGLWLQILLRQLEARHAPPEAGSANSRLRQLRIPPRLRVINWV